MNTKKFTLLFFITFFILSASAKEFILVIDPGHGGNDPGALGSFAKEKNINLKVALKVGELISNKFPDVKVVYTRKTDATVKLQERPNIANRANADLFMSIHTNASESTKAYGSETYTLGLSKSQANFNVAKRENSVLLLEDDKEVYQGFDPTSPDSYIMFEFMQSKYIDQSVELAYYVQKEFANIHRLDRGVRQAIFWVLHQVKMPSVLIELGFITNYSEEKFLSSEEGQLKMAKAIFRAFEQYKHEHDKRTITSSQIEKRPVEEQKEEVKETNAQKEETVTSGNKQKDTKIDKKVIEKRKEEESTDTDIQKNYDDNSDIIYKIQIFSTRTIIADNSYDLKKVSKFKPTSYFKENGWYKYMCANSRTYEEAKSKLQNVKQIYKEAVIVAFKDGDKISIHEAIKAEKDIIKEDEIIFKIQAFSSHNVIPNNNRDMTRLKKFGDVSYYVENGWYKYTCTESTTYKQAKQNLSEIQTIFKDAMIVAFKNGTKISLKEALK